MITPARRATRTALLALLLLVAAVPSIAAALSPGAQPVVAATPKPTAAEQVAAKHELTNAKAVVLGLVEGITEFLPISSTGHLHVVEQLLNVGKSKATKDATDSYTVIIQAGAILAVLLISWRRVVEVFQGLIGKSEPGRRLLFALVAAFVPAAVIGVALDKTIEKHLLKTAPIAAAWIVGGLVILALRSRRQGAHAVGRALESITPKEAVIIGFAQSLALWPGVSRSLVTILAALLIGLSLSAAVEFSFLLGLLTLGAATAYKLLKDGSLVFDTFGKTSPLIGIVVAFVSAAVAVKWMIAYLNRKELTVFAYYRIAVGIVTLGLMTTTLL